ncbi:fungal-specific transcription factor domain-containing protein [Aspergillus coremiiformis]|uniref:Fungal-specific transcription factor domain-containing protein n=1 Tax=Aspergillus coremiiformis TaxID=138285 RepID=A0A5N6ZHE8_9EURO|nr:fungal-specific transcription factor domain-containing protein [Aspergillus coremiiformis]
MYYLLTPKSVNEAISMTAVSTQRHRTCQQCRLRKVRCDGRQSICSNCDRLQFACSFQTLDSASPVTYRPERLRARQACSRCHGLKVRCSGHLPACLRCQKRGRECVYSSGSPKVGSAVEERGPRDTTLQSLHREDRTNPEPPTTNVVTMDPLRSPDTLEIENALDIFFLRIYPLPGYAFLHRASLYDRFHRGQADQCLLLSIISISTFLTETNPSKREYAAQYLKTAEQLIISNLSQPSIVRTQALLLIVRCKMCLGEYASAFPLVSILSRFAFSLRLNYDNHRVCFLAREARRRLIWAVYMLDQSWAGGLMEFTTCPVDAIYVNLPCTEETWELDVCPETEVQLKSPSKLPGLLAGNVCVSYLRDRVLRHAKRFAAGNSTANEIVYGIRELEAELEYFYRRLPPASIYSERNLRLRAHSPWLPRFVVLHVLWHQCYCDLYRCITSGLIESVPEATLNKIDHAFILRCRQQCTQHAMTIAGIFTSLLDLRLEISALPLEIAACAYQSVRLLLHLGNDNHGVHVPSDRITQYKRSCLQIIQLVARTSPSVATIERDLQGLINENQDRIVHPESRPRHTQQNPRQVLSIHALIARSGFVDDSEDLALQDSQPIDGPPAYEKHGRDSHDPLATTGRPFPHRNLGSVEDMAHGSNMAADMWLQGSNAFEGAWDEPGIGFDLIRQMQWDGMGYHG